MIHKFEFGDWHFHVHKDDSSQESSLLQTILNQLSIIVHRGEVMSVEMDNLTAEVAATRTVIDSAIVLIQGFQARLDAAIAAGGDPAMLQALSDDLHSSEAALSAAVAANTVTP